MWLRLSLSISQEKITDRGLFDIIFPYFEQDHANKAQFFISENIGRIRCCSKSSIDYKTVNADQRKIFKRHLKSHHSPPTNPQVKRNLTTFFESTAPAKTSATTSSSKCSPAKIPSLSLEEKFEQLTLDHNRSLESLHSVTKKLNETEQQTVYK